jgi:hypothetical protein
LAAARTGSSLRRERRASPSLLLLRIGGTARGAHLEKERRLSREDDGAAPLASYQSLRDLIGRLKDQETERRMRVMAPVSPAVVEMQTRLLAVRERCHSRTSAGASLPLLDQVEGLLSRLSGRPLTSRA